MKEKARLGLRLPVHINCRLEEEAKNQYISKNTLAIQIFEKWLKDKNTTLKEMTNEHKRW